MFRKTVGTLFLIFLFFGCTTFQQSSQESESLEANIRNSRGYGYATKQKYAVAFGSTEFKNFKDAVSTYEKSILPKAFVIAYDSEVNWVAGRAWNCDSLKEAINLAKVKCEDLRKEKSIINGCLLFAANDEFYYAKDPNIELARTTQPPYIKSQQPSSPPKSASRQPSTSSPSEKEKVIGSGTGFAVREDGYILTCYHIVATADSISVISGGKPIRATLLKQSRSNDLALIKISRKTPNYLELVEPDSVRMGERVFTIGFPVTDVLGVEPKYTDGTISSLSGIQDEASLLQISVPVQPGNSGGPLVNDDGKVVGIITSRAADIAFFKTAGALPQNVNWAVKAEMAGPLFKKPSYKKQKISDRNRIIENTQKSVYMVVVTKSK